MNINKILVNAKRLTSHRIMDIILPRVNTRSHMTLSSFRFHQFCSSTSSSWFPLQHLLDHHHHHHFLSVRIFIIIQLHVSSVLFNTRNISSQQFNNMADKFPHGVIDERQDIEKAIIKDEMREGYCKEACDDNKRRVADHIIPHILNLYASRATPQDFEIYDPNATFEDPLMCAHGVDQIKSAFYSLNKAFSESRIVDYTIQENVISPGKTEILIDNKQFYKFLGKDINMITLIKLYTEDGKIVRHEDWWDKKPIWNRETVNMPLMGRITEATRRASMLATHVLMRFGKDPTM